MSQKLHTKELIQSSDAYWENGERKQAIDILASLLKDGETNVSIHIKLAERLAEEKNYEEQISVLNKAVDILNTHFKSH